MTVNTKWSDFCCAPTNQEVLTLTEASLYINQTSSSLVVDVPEKGGTAAYAASLRCVLWPSSVVFWFQAERVRGRKATGEGLECWGLVGE